MFAEVLVTVSILSNLKRVHPIGMKSTFSLLRELLRGKYVNNLINTHNLNHPGLVIWSDTKRTLVVYTVFTPVAW